MFWKGAYMSFCTAVCSGKSKKPWKTPLRNSGQSLDAALGLHIHRGGLVFLTGLTRISFDRPVLDFSHLGELKQKPSGVNRAWPS